jgi:hypothetical protein
MKVQENQTLKTLAAISGKEPKQLSLEIYEHLEMWDLLDGSGNYWGHTIKDCIKDEDAVKLVLCGLSIKPTDDNAEMVLSLILMLGGDCQECGRYMEVDPERSEYKHIHGDGYNDPIEYAPVSEVYFCLECLYSEVR